MSIFNKDLIKSEITPQKYFEMLCERKFGFNFTNRSRYDIDVDVDNSFILNDIICETKLAYPNKHLYWLCSTDGHIVIVEDLIL